MNMNTWIPTPFLLGAATVLLVACGGSDESQSAATEGTAGPTIHVATSGSDTNPGTAERPLASIARALETLAQAGTDMAGKQILLGDGVHYLRSPLTLDARFSGAPGRPFVIGAQPGARPVLSGARVLNLNWMLGGNGVWTAPLPGPAIDALYVNGERQVRARYPNFNAAVRVFNGHAADAIAPARVATWRNPEGGFFHAMHPGQWGDVHFRINGKNADGTLALGAGVGNNRGTAAHSLMRYVENVFEELDVAKEWYHDPRTGTLHYRAPANIDPRSARIEAPEIEGLIRLAGSEAAPVHDIAIRGLVLTQTTQTFMKTTEPLLRSDWMIHRGGAVMIEGAQNIEVSGNDLIELGGNAVFVNGYNRNIAIRGNEIVDIGASAIAFVGKPEAVRNPLFEYGQWLPIAQIDRTPGPKTNDYPALSIAENNLIHRTGRVEKQSAGVQISMSSEITVRSNSIYDVPRAAINVNDGTWGGHVIEFNDAFRTVLETSDHGAYNSWGRDRFWHPNRGTMNAINAADPTLAFLDAIKPILLRNNRFRCDHGWDIDLDDGSTNYIIENNLMLARGLKNREGFRRISRNNILVNNTFHPHAWFANSQDRFERNIVMRSYGPVSMPTSPWGERLDDNLFRTLADLQSSQSNGRDLNSRYGDPGFADPTKGDFTVAANSPALAVGFVNVPMDRFGVQEPRLKAKADRPVFDRVSIAQIQLEAPSLFAGVSVKSVQTEGEQSATGLPTIAGVLVLSVPVSTDGARSGLIPNDAIVEATVSGRVMAIRHTADLLSAQSQQSTGVPAGQSWQLTLGVYRDQVKRPLVLTFSGR